MSFSAFESLWVNWASVFQLGSLFPSLLKPKQKPDSVLDGKIQIAVSWELYVHQRFFQLATFKVVSNNFKFAYNSSMSSGICIFILNPTATDLGGHTFPLPIAPRWVWVWGLQRIHQIFSPIFFTNFSPNFTHF